MPSLQHCSVCTLSVTTEFMMWVFFPLDLSSLIYREPLFEDFNSWFLKLLSVVVTEIRGFLGAVISSVKWVSFCFAE